MNFETDERRFRRDIWTIGTIKLIKEFRLKNQYKAKKEEKDSKEAHRLYSETVKLMYDDSIALNIGMGVTARKNQGKNNQLDLDDPSRYFLQSGQAL